MDSERVVRANREAALAVLKAGPYPSYEICADALATTIIASQKSTRWVIITDFGHGTAYGPYASEGIAVKVTNSGLLLGNGCFITTMKGGTVDDLRLTAAHSKSALEALKRDYKTLEEAANSIAISVIETDTPTRWIAVTGMNPPTVYGMFAGPEAARSYCRKLGEQGMVLAMKPVPRVGHRREGRDNGW